MPKLWTDRTTVIGIVSKQSKTGDAFVYSMIACEFDSWIAPKFEMLLIKLSLGREN